MKDPLRLFARIWEAGDARIRAGFVPEQPEQPEQPELSWALTGSRGIIPRLPSAKERERQRRLIDLANEGC